MAELRIVWSGAAALMILLALASTGCGGAAAQAAPAQPGAAAPPGDLVSASADLDRAEQDLNAALGPVAAAGAPAPKSAPETAAPAAEPPPAAARSEAAPRGGGAAPSSSATGCEAACRALASMERATEHLCALAGDGDARCSGARERVKSASERVRSGCPACK